MLPARYAGIHNADKEGLMEDYCNDCIDCNESWSAGGGLSCHEFCEKFKQWKEGYYRKATDKDSQARPGNRNG